VQLSHLLCANQFSFLVYVRRLSFIVVCLQLTWADLGLLNVADWLKVIGEHAKLAEYEKLDALVKRTAAVPNVAAYLAKRPVTPW
jgi:hypothetical protein